MNIRLNYLRILSIIISIIVIFVSCYSIINQNIYNKRVSSIPNSELLSQDTVTLLIGIMFLVFLILEKSKPFLTIINTGFLSYFFYVYFYYSFSLISSFLFLLYLLIFSSSMLVMVFRILDINTKKIIHINNKYPRKSITIFLIIVSLIMYIIEIPYLIETTIINTKKISTYDIFYFMDIGIVFPIFIIVAIQNMKKNPNSFLLVGIAIIKTITIMLALLFGDLYNYFSKGFFSDISFDLIGLVFTIISIIILFLYKRGIVIEKNS